jgi:CTP synthase
MLANRESAKKEIKIAIVGKYFTSGSYSLEDAYVCVIEAIKHASWAQNVKPVIKWLDVENYNPTELKEFDGVIIPQGWGSRGVEGKIKAIEFLRKNKIPYLGLCFGMQMAAIEYARNVLKLKDANSEEADPNTPNPIIHIMPNQKEYLSKNQYGGTIRLGSWPCKVKENSLLEYAYKKFGKDDIEKGIINERHRHRYEVNNEYKEKLIEKGLIISGTSPDGKLAEVVELPKSVHPFFLGTQFHPEYKSWPLKPHPLFMAFIEACLK